MDIMTLALAKKMASGSGEGGGSQSSDLQMYSVTYSELKDIRDSGELVAGAKYRITDYVTKINGTYDLTAVAGQTAYLHYARSAEHPFDLIVTALDSSTLDEHAAATQHSGDTYFANSALEKWDIKYTLDNNPAVYSWADATNGKGVIYYLKDEFENEVSYDFKNIQFIAYALGMIDPNETPDGFCYSIDWQFRCGSVYAVTRVLANYVSGSSYTTPFVSNKHDFTVGQLILTSIGYPQADATYLSTFNADFYYTFDVIVNGEHADYSLNQDGPVCCANVIGESVDFVLSAFGSTPPIGLSANIFQVDIDHPQCFSNHIDNNSYGNIFRSSCYCNYFGFGAQGNIFLSSNDNHITSGNRNMCEANFQNNSGDINWLYAGYDCSNNHANGTFGECSVGDYFKFNIVNGHTGGAKFGSHCEHNIFVGVLSNIIIPDSTEFKLISRGGFNESNPIEIDLELSNEPFVVTCTPTAADYSGTMDKTVAEIDAAYKAGRKVLFRVLMGADAYAEVNCSVVVKDSGHAYSSYGGFTINIDNSILIYAYTPYSDNGTLNTYSTDIYSITRAS